MVVVRSPTAAIQVSANGACPPSCRQGWKWSLTATLSIPCASAATAISTSSRGSNCSADALYPSFSATGPPLSGQSILTLRAVDNERVRLGLDADRLLPIDPSTRAVARRLYDAVADAPILSQHGHVDPRLLLDDDPFPDPVELLV